MNLDKSTQVNECEVTIDVKQTMKKPVFVYYQLDNFYQNHRRYVKSKDYKQLMGEKVAVADLGQCNPIETNANLANVGIKYNVATPPTPLVDTEAATPCGLIAKSIFTDSYEIIPKVATDPQKLGRINVYQKDIAWKSDV